MSYRKAKQLLERQRLLQQASPQPQQEDEQEEEETTQPAKNTFSLLGDNDDDSEQEQPRKKSQQEMESKLEVEEGEKKKKKKRKKNKKKAVKEGEQQEDQELKEVKATLKQMGMEADQNEQQAEKGQEWTEILSIHEGRFNYQKELRRHFRGWQIERQEGDPDLTKKEQKMQKHLRKMMRKSVLSPGVTDYFPIREKFEILREDDSIQFVANRKYTSLQREYDVIRNSNDINALIQFTRLNPQHVDSLYDVGEFLRLEGNYRDADSLIQRVIYIYEVAGGYQLGQFLKNSVHKRQIKYDSTSKSFFMSLFKFMDILGKKGCFRAALEYNKFLLKINLDDPTACLLCIDFNSISSKQYEFLLSFVQNFGQYCGLPHRSLYLMPNFTYSVALAQFHIATSPPRESELIVEQNKIQEYLEFTDQHWKEALSFPKDFAFAKEDPRVLILRAIMMYSKLIIDIAAKNEYSKQFLNYQCFKGWQKKSFKDILAHEFWSMVPQSYAYYFLSLESMEDSQGLDKVLDVYVERSKILWKSNDVMLWVKGAMGFVLNKIDQKFEFQGYLENLCLEESGGVPVPFGLGRYSNINRNNFSDRVDRIDLNNIQDNQQMAPLPGQQLNMQQNGFQLFLNSLLPWVNVPGAGQEGAYDPDMPFIEQDEP